MNESTGKMSSCLAVTEKRQHRPGGCVGIFFQLFDWNRRFAKKKLFSRKLLPPARTKQASKKFAGDEKMPKTKLLLTADENSGGFSSVKKNGNRRVDMEQKHDMRTPSLVARLMGLESMPAIQRDKPKKAAFSSSCDVKEEKVVNNNQSVSNGEDLNLEKGNNRLASRPQKIQKTGPSERGAVTRFGAESLQIKNVLSRSRKHHHSHHPKLVSPVKSPRISSSRSLYRASTLIGAATKILEPGLQATNRAKCALTYTSPARCTPKDESLMEEIVVMSPHLVNESGYNNMTVGESIMGQTSCKNCGNLLDVVDSRPKFDERPFAYPAFSTNLDDASPQEMGKSKLRTCISSPQQDSRVVFQRSPDSCVALAAQEKENMRTRGASSPERKPQPPQPHEGLVQCHSTRLLSKPQKDEPASIAFKHRAQTQNQMSLSRDRIQPRAKLSNSQNKRVSSTGNAASGTKDFVALNRSLSGQTQFRVPSKVDNSNFETPKKSSNRQDESLSQVRSSARKRRTVIVNHHVESAGSVISTVTKQTNARCDAMSREHTMFNAQPIDQASIKNRHARPGEVNRANGNADNDVVSFTFNSPLRHKARISTQKEKRKVQGDFSSQTSSHCRKAVLNECDGQKPSQQDLSLKGDVLGALLQRKLKELTSQEEDESTMGTTAPKRSTAMILQELICALTIEQPAPQDGHMYNRDIGFQSKVKTEGSAVESSYNDHLSPGSVLEASFSNDSCFSSSMDDTPVSGHRLRFDSMDCSCDQPQLMEPDIELLDSATSLNKDCTGDELLTDLANQISTVLDSINSIDLEFTGSKLTNAKEVILNAEILFANVTPHKSNGSKHLLVGPHLLDKLGILAGALSTNLNCHIGFEETKEDRQIKGFLFDCLIESLDSKYCRYSNSGFKRWRRLPRPINTDMLIQDVGIELRKWSQLAGMVPDELIEWEMSHSLGKWTDFDIEAFENGIEIDRVILQALVEEVVEDLWECQLSCL